MHGQMISCDIARSGTDLIFLLIFLFWLLFFFLLGRVVHKSLRRCRFKSIGVKFRKIVLQVNMRRLTKLDL